MENAVLRITDGTDYVDLVGENSAIRCKEWRPVMANPKSGGVWGDSPFVHGRQLTHRVYENTIDNFILTITAGNQDLTIAEARKLRKLLQKATDYWTSSWATEFVWIEARASAETNIRYSVIKDWRAPGDNNPFGTPFFDCPSTMDEFSLLLEHDFWQGTIPGTGECVEVSAQAASPFPYYLEFAGGTATDGVDCLSAAALDNLTASAIGFTVDAWVRADGYGGGNNGRIMDKATAGLAGWALYINNSNGLSGYIGAPTPAFSNSGLDEFAADGEWHHVEMSYNDAGDRKIRLFIDGVQVTTYPSQQAAVGVLTSDAAQNMGIGNNIAGDANCWDGGIGWCRLRNGVVHAANFTPPPRCVLPNVVSGTYAIWICEGTGNTVYNKVGTAGTDGTITGATWATDCETLYGREAVCSPVGGSDGTLVANARWGMLSHVFYYDASVPSYSANLLSSTPPYFIFPQPFAIGDILYMESDTTGSFPAGPFMSVAFDLGTLANSITTIAWEYWNGAWVALAGVTSTGGNLLFGITGVNVIYFNPPADWAITTVNGGTGFFIRARITGIGAPSTGGTQQNRNVYAMSNPFLEIADDQIVGDIEALVRHRVYPRNLLASHGFGRLVFGGRSVSRGADFTAYLNFSDYPASNPWGMVVTSDVGAFASDPRTPSGRYYTNAVGDDTVAFEFPAYLINQYKGYFRLLLRNYQNGGAAGDWTVSAMSPQFLGSPRPVVYSVASSLALPMITDCGIVPIFPNVASELGVSGSVAFAVKLVAGASTLNLIDFALIPIDEFTHDVSTTSTIDESYPLNLDSITVPKNQFVAEKYSATTGLTSRMLKNNSVGPFVLPREKNVRIWYSMMQYFSAVKAWAGSTNEFMSSWIDKTDRFFTHRGQQ